MERSTGGSAQIYVGQKYLSAKSFFDFSKLKKREKSAGGSAQIYFGQKYLSSKSVFGFSKLLRRKCLPEALPKFILGRNT